MGDQFASIKKLKTELGKWFLSARIFQIHANFKKISDHEIEFLNIFTWKKKIIFEKDKPSGAYEVTIELRILQNYFN